MALTPSNIYRIDFEETFGRHTISHTVIFNITQISEEEVNNLIQSGDWWNDDRIISVRPKQVECFQDKDDC